MGVLPLCSALGQTTPPQKWRSYLLQCNKINWKIISFLFLVFFGQNLYSSTTIVFENSLIHLDSDVELMCENVTSGGEIGENEFGCPNPTWDPSLIYNITLPMGGTGDLEYIWIFTTDDPTSPGAFWNPIPGSTGPEYDPDPITVTTYYRRCARRSGCTDYIGESNIIAKEAICCDNITDGGKIADDQVFCTGPADPALLINTLFPTGGSLQPIEYQWAMSTTGTPYTPTNPDWLIIAGANDPEFDPVSITETTYYIRLSRRYGCFDYEGASNIIEIYIGDDISVSLTSSPVSCVGDNDGSAEITNITGGEPDYTYIWTNIPGAFGDTLVGLLPGMYEVVVTDNKGCTGSASIDVAPATPLNLTTSKFDALCHDSSDGSAMVQTLGGVLPYTYLWDDLLAQTTPTANGLSAGVYTVTVTDANNCTAVISETVNAPEQAMVSVSGADIICFGANDGTAEVSISNYDISDYSIIWSNGQSTPVATGLLPGDYFVTVSDVNGCTEEDSISIAEPSLLELTMVGDSASCFDSNDGSAEVIATGGTPFGNNVYLYEWSAAGSSNVPMLDNVTQGTYSVTVTDANDCSMSSSIAIGAPDQIEITTNVVNVTCNGFSDGSVFADATGGVLPYSYVWDDPNNTSGAFIDNLPANAYTVTLTDANNCVATRIANVTEPPQLTTVFNNTDVICVDATDGVALTNPSGGTPPYLYSWSNGQAGQAIFNLGIGSYTVTITDFFGCEIIETTEIIATTTLGSSVTSFDATCFDLNNGVAIANGTNGTEPYEYLWSNGATTAQINDLFFGVYNVTVTDADGCSVTNSVAVDAPPLLEASIQVLTEVATYNGSEGSAQVNPTGGVSPYTYVWTNGATSQATSGLGGGAHSVTVTDANNCVTTAVITLEEPSKIGDYVWDDLNQNGIQDATEVGLGGIEVYLTGVNSNGDSVNMTVQTDTTGFYCFDGLKAGFYCLKFDEPTNHLITYQNVGNDFFDSDPDPATGKTVSFNLSQGEFESKWDAGLIVLDEKINIGDKVWYDTDRDGIQDNWEGGVEGIVVRLWDLSTNTIIGVDVTDQLGNYLFECIYPGDYQVEFSMASFPPGGYGFSPMDEGTDDAIDSDPDIATGLTDPFVVYPFTLDNLTIDAGIFKECDNITDGGVIGYDEELCGVGADPAEIVSVTDPSGGWGVIEYLWMRSSLPIYNGPGDPNWTIIPNTNTPTYDPGPIGTSTYYIRCARREGCDEYIGESNVVAKEIVPLPNALITDSPNLICRFEPSRFEAAIAGAGATYEWSFPNGGSPSSATTRVVDPVSWSIAGGKTVELTVTRFGCPATATASVVVDNCIYNPLIIFDDVFAEQEAERIKIKWNVTGNTDKTVFFVQSSNDGINFTTIGNAKGINGLDASQYVFYDDQPRFGENIYRILFEKLDEELESGYSDEADVMYKRFESEFVQVFPNPTFGTANIELLEVSDEPVTCEIVNSFGEKIMTLTIPEGEKFISIDLENERDGLYFVKVKQAGWRAQICKLFKSK